jgi:formamidopyrimidine-DNA glycosylase
MPELPEVEILAGGLARRLRQARIVRVESRDSKITLPKFLAGQRIRRVWRRGKFIVCDLSGGQHLLTHLRMTGWLEFDQPSRYRCAIHTNKGAIYFEDLRRFGQMRVVSDAQLRKTLGILGPEPLERGFNLGALRTTSRAVKAALLDQRIVAGLGNIYANEALWRARIDPRRAADRLSAAALRRLRRGIVEVLRRAVGHGRRIFEAQRFAVYERAGRPCRRCRTPIRRVRLAQRGTYFCPACQH